MNKFLIVLILGTFFITLAQAEPSKQDTEMQTICAKVSSLYFDREYAKKASTNIKYSYTNHYNKKLDKCFIEVEETWTKPKEAYMAGIINTTDSLIDADLEKPYAHYQQITKLGRQIDSEEAPVTCKMLKKKCKNRREYQKFVSLYMKD